MSTLHFRWLVTLTVLVSAAGSSVADDWFERKTAWHGFDQFHFTVADRAAYVVTPKSAATGQPWIWRARFPGFHFEMDVELVKQGYHVAYVDVGAMYGSPHAMAIADQFYEVMTTERGLSKKPVLEGVSRGGLVVYNWAARHPQKVACIYCDTPVLDFKSWPAGRGNGVGSPSDWKRCLAVYGFDEQQALEFTGNPLDHAGVIAKQKIPVLHIVSENDRIVPPAENTYLLRDRLVKHGHQMEIISVPEGTEKSRGHHFTHPEPGTVVDFILKHGSAAE